MRLFFGVLNVKKRVKLHLSWRKIPTRKNNDVVIVAGGPSFTIDLAKCLIENKANVDITALNFYCLNALAEELVPDYYVLSDPCDFSEMNNDASQKLRSYINIKKPTLFHPYGTEFNGNVSGSFIFDDEENLNSDNISPLLPRGYTSNTALKAIALMLALGYDKVFVLGCDYDYPRRIFINNQNRIMLKDEHHYGVETVDISHLHKSIADALSCWANDYRHMKKLASDRVYNVTKNSLIDSFNRISPDEFIDYLNKKP